MTTHATRVPARCLGGRLTVVWALVSGGPATASPPADGKLVVVLYSGDTAGRPAAVAADRGFRAALAAGPAGHVEVRSEYVDTPRPGDPDLGRLQRKSLRTKYAGRRVEPRVAVLPPALDFALAHRSELFPAAPLVFCAVEGWELAARPLPPDVVGVPMRVELAATLDTALRLHPAARRVFVMAGAPPFDLYWEGEARWEFRAYEDRLEFEYLSGLPMADLLDRAAGPASCPPGSRGCRRPCTTRPTSSTRRSWSNWGWWPPSGG